MKFFSKLVLSIGLVFSLNAYADECLNINTKGKPISQQQFQDICRSGYSIGYNYQTKAPAWVAERLTREGLTVPKGQQKVKRTDNFRPDPLVPVQYSATLKDYRGSGYDRGHMAPAEDFRASEVQMSDSFYLSNIVPQNAPLNRGTWAILEKMMRYWAQQYEEILVISGPIYYQGNTLGSVGTVPIPTHFYKAVYIPKTNQSIAFILPNQKVEADQISNSRSTVKNLELLTGIQFFPNASDQVKTSYPENLKIFNK